LIVYGVIEIPGKILQGVLANQKLVSALFQLGVSSIGAGCSILLAAVWAKKEAFYVSFLFLGSHYMSLCLAYANFSNFKFSFQS